MTNHHVLPDEAIAATGTIELGYRYDVAGERGEEGRPPLLDGSGFELHTPLGCTAA